MRYHLALATAAVLAASSAHAGTLVVTGDSTVAFRQNTGVVTGNAALAGNVQFARNLLAGGTDVRIFGGPNLPDYTGQLVAGFNGLGGGVTASAFNSTITEASLAGADLLVAFFPTRAFTVAEANVLRAFLRSGGNVFLGGEATTNVFGNPLGAAENQRINGLLELLGSSMRLEVGSYDLSDQFATAAAGEVVADPLTAGVSSFGYGLTTTVAGGNALFLTNGLRSFVSYEAVPEPASWALMISGFGLAGAALRGRKRVNVAFA